MNKRSLMAAIRSHKPRSVRDEDHLNSLLCSINAASEDAVAICLAWDEGFARQGKNVLLVQLDLARAEIAAGVMRQRTK